MNTLKENLKVLEQPDCSRLLARLERDSERATRLRYGFESSLSKREQLTAKKLNSVYESLVWGTIDDADHQGLALDERQLIDKWIKNSIYSTRVAEVGSGSGRISRYLIPQCKAVDLIERERLAIQRSRGSLQAALGKPGIKHVRFRQLDFSANIGRTDIRNGYTAILLLENLIGMNPLAQDRRAIIRNALNLLQDGGIAVFAHRCRKEIPEGFRYQVMPYEFETKNARVHQTAGFAINWSRQAIEREVLAVSHDFKSLDYISGGSRPAGGNMNYLIVRKWPKARALKRSMG